MVTAEVLQDDAEYKEVCFSGCLFLGLHTRVSSLLSMCSACTLGLRICFQSRRRLWRPKGAHAPKPCPIWRACHKVERLIRVGNQWLRLGMQSADTMA